MSHTGKDTFDMDLNASQRSIYWNTAHWEFPDYHSTAPKYASTWPSAEHARLLIDTFFEQASFIVTVVHRPTFEREFADGLYTTDIEFKMLCLVVFACASRCLYDADDEAITAKDDRDLTEDDRKKMFGKGWDYIGEYVLGSPRILEAPGVSSLQATSIAAMFVGSCSHHQVAWMCIGMGIRTAVDMGVHRKHVVRSKPKAEGEMLKRAFWALYLADRELCGSTGRPLAIHDEDIDVDYPIDVDDEYWENEEEPGLAFRQPEGKPSKIGGFIQLLKLAQIHGYCLRTIYAINKSKVIKDFHSLEAQLSIVAEIDSSLNNWVQQLPDHLRWDPHRKDDLWFLQSAHIYVAYYSAQIYTHRPFISPSADRSQPSFPSLAICSNAARAGANALHALSKRGIRDNLDVLCIRVAFQFGTVLAVNLWGGKRSSSSFDPRGILNDISKIIEMFTVYEKTWMVAGCLKDIIMGLVQHAHVTKGTNPTNKRNREDFTRNPQDNHHLITPSASSFSKPNSTLHRDEPRSTLGLPSSHIYGTMPAQSTMATFTPPLPSSCDHQQSSSNPDGRLNELPSEHAPSLSDLDVSSRQNDPPSSVGYSIAGCNLALEPVLSTRPESRCDLYQMNSQPQSPTKRMHSIPPGHPLHGLQQPSTQRLPKLNRLYPQEQQEQQEQQQQQQQQHITYSPSPSIHTSGTSMLYQPAAYDTSTSVFEPASPSELWPLSGSSDVPVGYSQTEEQRIGNVVQDQAAESVVQGARVGAGRYTTDTVKGPSTPDRLEEPSVGLSGMSDDVMTGLWNSAPEGFEVEEWISYLFNLSGDNTSFD